jgi:dissimilatory sulfite reductase (desulfoviridin) alpha/beta subunit
MFKKTTEGRWLKLSQLKLTVRDLAKPDERLSTTINRVGFEEFKKTVESKLEQPLDDLIQEANDVREKERNAECIEHS